VRTTHVITEFYCCSLFRISAVDAREVGDTLEEAEALRRHAAAGLAKELDLRVPARLVEHEDPQLDASALAGAQLVRGAVRVLVAAVRKHAHADARVLVLVEVEQALENANAHWLPFCFGAAASEV
jgi:hypothetical protein